MEWRDCKSSAGSLAALLNRSWGGAWQRHEPVLFLLGSCCPLPEVQQYIHCLPKIRQVILRFLSCFLLAILEGTAASSTQLDRHTKMRSMSCISCLLCGLLLCGCYIHSNPHHSKKHVFFGGYSLLSFLTQNHTSLPAWDCTSSAGAPNWAPSPAELCHCPVSWDKLGCQLCWETSTDRQVTTPTQKDREMWISVRRKQGHTESTR